MAENHNPPHLLGHTYIFRKMKEALLLDAILETRVVNVIRVHNDGFLLS